MLYWVGGRFLKSDNVGKELGKWALCALLVWVRFAFLESRLIASLWSGSSRFCQFVL